MILLWWACAGEVQRDVVGERQRLNDLGSSGVVEAEAVERNDLVASGVEDA